VTGEWHGRPGSTVHTVRAKPGYAVGALDGNSGDRVDSLRITFMRAKDRRLDTEDAYRSDWFGGKTGAEHIGGSGCPVVGIHGRAGGDLEAIGFMEDVPPSR